MPIAAVSVAVALVTTSVLLAGPLSSALAAAHWPVAAPLPALLLWQAVCLAAGVTAVEAGLVVAVAPLGRSLPTGLAQGWRNMRAGRPLAGLSVVGFVCGAAAVLAALWLLAVLVQSQGHAGRRRRTHRQVLDLLVGDLPGAPLPAADVRVLDHPGAVAFTVPGWHARVVLSAGLVDLLDPGQLRAVVAHERAHARFRHDLLLLPFQAWAQAFGRLRGVRRAAAAVTELAEMLADDFAIRETSAAVVRTALVAVALTGAVGTPVAGDTRLAGAHPRLADGFERELILRRVKRLSDVRMSATVEISAALGAGLVILLPVAAVLVRW